MLRGDLVITARPTPAVPSTPLVPGVVDFKMLASLVSPQGTISVEDYQRCLKPKWTVATNGVIYITFPATTGRTGKKWITYFQQKGDDLSDYAKSVLRSKQFQPTTGVVHRIAILPAKLWRDNERLTQHMRQDAETGAFTNGQNLTDPNPEVGCLIRDYLTDEEIKALGFQYIVVMHPPIPDSGGRPRLLAALRYDTGRRLHAYYGHPDRQWHGDGGFAWSDPQVSALD